MASTVTPPRQLAPTVGQVAVLSGVSIRTGSCAAGRVLSRLVCWIGDLHQRQRGLLLHQRGDSTSPLSPRSSLISSKGSCSYPNHPGEIRVGVGNPSPVWIFIPALAFSSTSPTTQPSRYHLYVYFMLGDWPLVPTLLRLVVSTRDKMS